MLTELKSSAGDCQKKRHSPKTGAGVCLKIIERAVLLCFLDVFDDGVDDEFYIVVGDPWTAGEA